jgi:hypothetical protein
MGNIHLKTIKKRSGTRFRHESIEGCTAAQGTTRRPKDGMADVTSDKRAISSPRLLLVMSWHGGKLRSIGEKKKCHDVLFVQ